MKKNIYAVLYTSTGYPFALHGKRGRQWVAVEWECGLEVVRVPLWWAVRYPDTVLSLAVGKEAS